MTKLNVSIFSVCRSRNSVSGKTLRSIETILLSSGHDWKIFNLILDPESYIFGINEIGFHNTNVCPDRLERQYQSIIRSEVLIFIFPVWMYGVPSVLKGLFENIFKPGVTFEIEGDGVTPLLQNVKKVLVACSSGQKQDAADQVDCVKEFFRRLVSQNMNEDCELDFFRLWGTDTDNPKNLNEHLLAVESATVKISNLIL